MTDAEHTVIGGRYELQRKLGAGGMAEVWLAADLRLNRKKVAVKRLLGFRVDSPASAQDLERVRREAFAASRVSHPNLVSVTDFVAENDEPFIVMEYVAGSTLADTLDNGALPDGRAARVMSQVAMALADVHDAGLVHRDIKPANILLDRRGNAKVTDFGIARGAEDPRFTQTGFLSGTIAYLAPELLNGNDATPASDMWSFGATLFEAVEARRAFDGPTTPAILMQVAAGETPQPARPGPLADVIRALLDRTPERRPSAEEVADRLTDIAAQAGSPRPPAPTPPPQPPLTFTTPSQYSTPHPPQGPPRPPQHQPRPAQQPSPQQPPPQQPPPQQPPRQQPPPQQASAPPQQPRQPRPPAYTPPQPAAYTPPPRTQQPPPTGYNPPPPTGIQTGWPPHGPGAPPAGPSAYRQPGSSRKKILVSIAAVVVVGGGVTAIALAAGGGDSGGSGGAGNAQGTFDAFAGYLRSHDSKGVKSTICKDGNSGLDNVTDSQLSTILKVDTVNNLDSDNVGRLHITISTDAGQSSNDYDVTLADNSGWCVETFELQPDSSGSS